MRWLVGASLRLPYLVIAAAAVLLGVALQMLPRAQVDVFPEFAPPLVEIQTECPGLTSQQVEALVTVPLEGALGGLPWLATLRSKSVPGLSSVVLLFRRDADPLRARQLGSSASSCAASCSARA